MGNLECMQPLTLNSKEDVSDRPSAQEEAI